MNQRTQWLGFHGTSAFNAKNILNTNFLVSDYEKDWLGNGAYFFLEAKGLLPPVEKAAEWAFFRGPKNDWRYTISVLEAEIETEIHLDLDDEDHIAALDAIKKEYMQIMKREGKRPSGDRLLDKCIFCNYVMHEHGVDALVRREYIKSTADEIKFGIDGGVPNCRVMCVKDPAASIKNVRYAVERRRVK